MRCGGGHGCVIWWISQMGVCLMWKRMFMHSLIGHVVDSGIGCLSHTDVLCPRGGIGFIVRAGDRVDPAGKIWG